MLVFGMSGVTVSEKHGHTQLSLTIDTIPYVRYSINGLTEGLDDVYTTQSHRGT